MTEPIPDAGTFGVTLQQQYVTVTRDGTRVLDLDAPDFSVRDDGERQSLVTFARGDIPFTAVLLIDASASMVGDRLEAASAGVRSFVARSAELDRVAMLAFSDRLLERTPFGNLPGPFEDALAGLRPGQGTALHDHLYAALKLLEQRQGRRVVVLLSDGIDSHSVLEIEDVRRAVRRSQALVYWIWLGGDSDREFADGRLRGVFSTWRTTDEYRRQFELLRETVLDSGGRIVPVAGDGEIEPVFVDIVAELREQYVLGYYPSDSRDDGGWHEVRVDVRGAGLDVRTSRGYVDY
jgi:Ca-activated chloride channel family protein